MMAPENLNFMDVPQPVLDSSTDYAPIEGRKIFEEMSITGLNRSPIEILTAFITAESDIDGSSPIWPEIPLAKICEYVLVDGSFALRYTGDTADLKADEPYVFLKDCVEIHRNLIIQKLRNDNGVITDIVREYTREGDMWTVRDIRGYGTQHAQVVAIESYPADMLIAYPYGKGLLYPNQKTYRRLEEIEESIRKQTGPASLSLIVTGYTGDWRKAHNTFSQGASIIGIPGNVDVHRVAANNTTQDLIQDRNGLYSLFIDNMHLIKVSETAAISGRARIIAMRPMLSYVSTIRMVLDEIYALLGYTIEWGGIDVREIAELSAELDFLDKGLNAQILSIEEHQVKARALYGLTGAPEGTLKEKEPIPEPLLPENMDPNLDTME
jgi:hypothetical protein